MEGKELLQALEAQRMAEMTADTEPRNRVVLLYRDSAYGLQKYIVNKMKQILLEQGYRVCDISFSVANPYSNCDKQLGKNVRDVCLVFSMDTVGFEMLLYNGQRWINTMACPCVSYLYHHAGLFSVNLDIELSWNIEIHADNKENQEFIREWYPEAQDVKLIQGFAFEASGQEEWHSRKYDVYVPGDYIPSGDCYQAICKMPEVFRMIAFSMIDRMEKDASLSAWTALKQVLASLDFQCDHQEFFALSENMKIASVYVQMKETEDFIDSCLQQELSVAVYGSGWERYTNDYGIYLTLVHEEKEKNDFETHLNIMASAKCFVDMSWGGSESTMVHILSAMKNGAVVFSGRYRDLGEEWPDGDGIVFYHDGKQLASLAGHYFQSEDALEGISQKALSKSEKFAGIGEYVESLLHLE